MKRVLARVAHPFFVSPKDKLERIIRMHNTRFILGSDESTCCRAFLHS